jgi:hypothetical protein
MRQQPLPPKQTSRRPKWPIPLALLGLLGLALAAILASTNRGRSELPDNFNAVRQYTGTATSILNPQALQAGNFDAALMTNVPVTGQQTVRVLATSGDNARVLDERTLVSGGVENGTGSNTYAVNRRSLEPASGAPQDWNAQPHEGLTVAFPAGATQQDYTGWVSDTQTTTPLRFIREESRGGVNTFVYQADVAPTPIRDQSVLGSLPSTLSRAALLGLTPSLPISAEQRSALAQAAPGLPEQVPLSYTFQGRSTFWVEPTTGQVIDTSRQVIRSGTVGGPGGSTLANLPVYNVDTRFTDDTVAAAGTEAADRRDSLNSSGRVWPWILGTLGAVALLVGLIGLLVRRRPETVPRAPEPTYRPTEADTRRRDATGRTGEPQRPYSGTTPHTGPYREARPGQPPEREGRHRQPEQEHEEETRGQQGKQPPRAP